MLRTCLGKNIIARVFFFLIGNIIAGVMTEQFSTIVALVV